MDIPNIWLSAPGIAEAFREIDELSQAECEGILKRMSNAFGRLPHIANQGGQAVGVAATKARAVQPATMAAIKSAAKRILIESVPGLQYGSDTSLMESQLKADLEVAREIFRRTYGVEIKIGE